MAANLPAKFQSDMNVWTSILTGLSLSEILWWDVFSDIETYSWFHRATPSLPHSFITVSFSMMAHVQYIPRNMRTVFALLCFVVVIHWLIFPYPSGLLHWHCGNLTIAPVPAKQPWWIWINTSCEFIMNDCITTTKQSTTKPCAYFLGYTVHWGSKLISPFHDKASSLVDVLWKSLGSWRWTVPLGWVLAVSEGCNKNQIQWRSLTIE